LDHCAEFNNFEVGWALRPVVPPADDNVAPMRRMAVVSEVPTLKFKLDSHPLPLSSVYLTLCLAIRVPSLNGFNVIPQFTSDHAKEEYNTLLVDWLMTKPTEVNRVPVRRAAIESGVSMVISAGNPENSSAFSRRCEDQNRRLPNEGQSIF
jgi:hypothetical protein